MFWYLIFFYYFVFFSFLVWNMFRLLGIFFFIIVVIVGVNFFYLVIKRFVLVFVFWGRFIFFCFLKRNNINCCLLYYSLSVLVKVFVIDVCIVVFVESVFWRKYFLVKVELWLVMKIVLVNWFVERKGIIVLGYSFSEIVFK